MTQSIRNFIFDNKEIGVFLLTALAVFGVACAVLIPSYLVSLNMFGFSEATSFVIGAGVTFLPVGAVMFFVSGR